MSYTTTATKNNTKILTNSIISVISKVNLRVFAEMGSGALIRGIALILRWWTIQLDVRYQIK